MSVIQESLYGDYKKSYLENGYVIVENFITPEECDEIKKESLQFAELPNYPVVLNLHRRSDFFWKIISNSNLVKFLRYIQDSDIDAVNDQFLFKLPNTKYGKQSWTFHQDNSYPRAKKNSYIVVHLAVDESTKDNGGLIYLKGSHVEDILEFESNKSWKEDATKSGITRPGQTIKSETEMLKKYEAIDIEFPKGAISLMHGNLIHGSHANLSKNKSRNQYSMCFMNRGVDFFVGKSSPRIRAKLY